MSLRRRITNAVYDHARADDIVNAVMRVVEAELAAARWEPATEPVVIKPTFSLRWVPDESRPGRMVLADTAAWIGEQQ